MKILVHKPSPAEPLDVLNPLSSDDIRVQSQNLSEQEQLPQSPVHQLVLPGFEALL